MVCLLSFFLAQGLVDEPVWHPRSVAAGSGAFFRSQPRRISCITRTRLDRHAVTLMIRTTHTTRVSSSSADLCMLTFFFLRKPSGRFAMLHVERAHSACGSARRRRERRLRSFWRHEQMAVQMVLATVSPPLLRQGGHHARRPTGTEARHQDCAGRGARVALHGGVPDDSSPSWGPASTSV